MAWLQTGDRPLSEPIVTQFTDANVLHLGGWVKIAVLKTMAILTDFKVRRSILQSEPKKHNRSQRALLPIPHANVCSDDMRSTYKVELRRNPYNTKVISNSYIIQ